MTITGRAQSILLPVYIFAVTGLLDAAETGAGNGPHPEPLVLADGRTFSQWKIIGETASTLTIRSERAITKIPKIALMDPMAAAYPLDGDSIVAERKKIEASHAEAADRRARDKARADEEARIEHLRDAEIAKQQTIAAERKATELAASRDGLLLIKLRTSSASALVTMKNVSEGTQTFDWRQLRGRSVQGDLRQPTMIMPRDTQFGYGIEAGQMRTFEIAFGAHTMRDGNGLSHVCWVDEIWLRSADEDTSVKALLAKNTPP